MTLICENSLFAIELKWEYRGRKCAQPKRAHVEHEKKSMKGN